MQTSDSPSLIPVPFANSGTKNAIPTSASPTPGLASLETGFPPATMTPIVAGGIPPAGADFNGILNLLSAASRWSQAGGGYTYNAEFSIAIGGYPRGALLRAVDGSGQWFNLVENNTTDPDAGGANWTKLAASVPAVNMRVFTISGTWTKPAGLKSVVVEVQGAGGSGGGAMSAGSGNVSIGGGGLGGGYSRKRILAAELNAAEDVTVGAGGARVAGGTGLTGGQSSFGAHCQATGGGFGGITTANSTLAVISSNGSPGIGIGGDVNSAGGFSVRGIRFDGTPTGSFAGDGGASHFCGSQSGTAGNNNGVDALSYGGGGGGAHSTGSSAKEGGKGGDGLVIIWEFF
ncbi:glycine-rich domain-containing protein [Bordetella bronchiseptica]